MNQYTAELTTWTNLNGNMSVQVRIDHPTKGYYIIEINPNTKESYIIKDKLKNEEINNSI